MSKYEVTIGRRGLLKRSGVAVAGVAGVAGSATARRQTGGVERWRYETDDSIRSSPTIVGGTTYIGSKDGYVHAVEEGRRKWRTKVGEVVGAAPQVVGRTVYVQGMVLDAGDGTERWTYDGETPSSATVVDDQLFDSGLFSFFSIDTESQSRAWEFGSYKTGYTSPTVVDGVVYVGSLDKNLYAISIEDGAEQWRQPTGRSIVAAPTVADGTVYGSSVDNYVYAIDKKDGTISWLTQIEQSAVSSPTIYDGTLYIRGDTKVYAIDAEDGSVRWFVRSDRADSSPTVAGGTVFVGGGSHLLALDAEDGTERWRFETGGRVSSSPTVVDGTVYVGSNDSNLYAIEADVTASSSDSRVRLGTLGHHHEWAGQSSGSQMSNQNGNGTRVESTEGDGTGIGLVGGLASLGGGGLLVRRWLSRSR